MMAARFEAALVPSLLFFLGFVQPHLRGGLASSGDGVVRSNYAYHFNRALGVYGRFGTGKLVRRAP
jgi:hypothetical protein